MIIFLSADSLGRRRSQIKASGTKARMMISWEGTRGTKESGRKLGIKTSLANYTSTNSSSGLRTASYNIRPFSLGSYLGTYI